MNAKATLDIRALRDDIATLEQERIDLATRREPLDRERAQLLADTAGRPLTGTEERRLRELEDAIRDIDERGEPQISRGGQMYRRLSLRAIDARLEELRTRLATAQAAALVDPNEQVRCRLRRLAKHYVDGRLLRVGEEVLLTRAQLEMFADRFELVG